MRSSSLVLALTAALVAPSLEAAPPARRADQFRDLHHGSGDKTVVLVDGDPAALTRAGFDLARHGTEKPGEPVHVVADAAGLERLAALGFTVVRELDQHRRGALGDDWSNFDQVMERVNTIVAANPDIMHLFPIGTSLEGRTLVAVRVSNTPQVADPSRPRVSFNAAHHAREVMTVEVVLDILQQVSKRYRDGDAAAKRWIEELEIYVTPLVNPDGFSYVHTDDTWWRKNRRNNGDSEFGVDLNRNYPYAWGANDDGSSSSTWSETYRGAGPASEPEVAAMVGLARQTYPLFNMSFHSYGEVLLYPYGYEEAQNPEGSVMESLSTEIASRMKRDTGSGTYNKQSRLYPVNGLDRDWYYWELGSYCFVPEISSPSRGFHPSKSWVKSTTEGLRGGWLYLLDRALGAGIRGRLVDAATQTPIVGKVQVDGVVWKNGEPESTSPDGYFHRLLDPGAYTLQIQAEGYHGATTDVTVTADGIARVEVPLTALPPPEPTPTPEPTPEPTPVP